MPLTGRLSVDIGGTFTDLVLLANNGLTFSAKVSSTPLAPEDAVISGMAELLDTAGMPTSALTEVLHGTTVGSNTLLQKLGARTGLITTKGFRDVLEIGRLRTPGMFDLTWDKPEPLVARRYRLEVAERTHADGSISIRVDTNGILAAGAFFRDEGIESVAICFLNSYTNPDNERAAARMFSRAFPEIAVTVSVDVLPEAGEYERTSTAVVNAYVLPALRFYLARLESRLRAAGVKAPLLIGNSNGGLSASATAQRRPVFFISSGRSSGAVGAERLAAVLGEPNLVAFDMGGTTASAALVHRGVLSRTHEYEFRAGMSVPSRFIKAGGYMMRVPTVDVAEVGNGAGSIAAIDAAGLLTVGPLSAGAAPGPVCYSHGGSRPTVTDANVVLGYLPPQLAGGSLKLDVEAARAVIGETLGRPLGLSIEAAAFGVREIANANMVRAIRAVTVERGLDPRELTLLAFGGSGPVHACDLARTLGIARVVFPPAPGVFTAMGMLAGSVEHHELRSAQARLDRLDQWRVDALRHEMRLAATAALAAQGYAAATVSISEQVDLRLDGQDASLSIPFSGAFDAASLRTAFIAVYRDTYGYEPTDAIEAVALRLRAEARVSDHLDFTVLKIPRTQSTAGEEKRLVYFERTVTTDTPIIRRESVAATLVGPAIIEGADTTIVIPPGARVEPDATGSLIATLEGAS
ncbi:hydantoinase/oxoprolinase family protein [Mesorhizobium sp. NZP2077]|uniref:hydantoinase/oxoprolinase family protein n=1 Tax=Mesorhizobium sp. NZP2077 TaxID=2483404 RepID=UPI001558075F|nr:hydantoinase/oxoprolinase family protein [Mesorhizobium sp. NZP2077]QKC85487.1 hydantoinase/oxoprolinase family protein [Mesorhizobium sp. NZP2077]QKD19124.1 hydantoinase/oxoprolinase family protein [Mesorhizobium sp. NZP2077]